MHYLIDSGFQAITRLATSFFENENDRRAQIGHYLPKVEIEDYNFIINGDNLFDQPVTKDLKSPRKHLQNCNC